jgi:hypothetical protein
VYHAAALSPLSAPRITIFSASSGKGRWRALASSHGARIHTSRSSSVVRITGMALGWIGSTTAFGAVVGVADHGSRVIRKYTRHRRKVAYVAIDHAEEGNYRGLVCSDRIEVAHSEDTSSQ